LIACDGLADAPESRAALATGKQATRTGLLIGSRHGEWACTLDGRGLTLSSIRLADSKEPDRAARLEARLLQVRALWNTIDELFGCFLSERLNGHWSATANRLRQWAAGRLEPARQPRLATA
jgi:hypothetical protein